MKEKKRKSIGTKAVNFEINIDFFPLGYISPTKVIPKDFIPISS